MQEVMQPTKIAPETSGETRDILSSLSSIVHSRLRSAQVTAASLGVVFGSTALPSLAQTASSKPDSTLATSPSMPPQTADANPFLLPYRAMVGEPDYRIPFTYEAVAGFPTTYNLSLARNVPFGAKSGASEVRTGTAVTSNPFAVDTDFFFTPIFFLEERRGPCNVESAEAALKRIGETAPPVIIGLKRASNNLVSVTFAFNNSFPALVNLATEILQHEKPLGAPPSGEVRKGIRAGVLPVTDAFFRIVDRGENVVLATGYTDGILNAQGAQPFRVLFTEENLRRFCEGYDSKVVSFIWYYRYSNIGGSFVEAFQDFDLDISSELKALRNLSDAKGPVPITVSQVDEFKHTVAGKLRAAFRTNDASLAPLAAQLASEQVVNQAFTAEQTMPFVQFSQTYPQFAQTIIAQLAPQVQHIVQSEGRNFSDTQTHSDSETSGASASVTLSGGTGGGGSGPTDGTSISPGAGGGGGGGIAITGSVSNSSTTMDQVQKATGLTFQKTASGDSWQIRSITFRHVIDGVQSAHVSGNNAGLVINPPNAGLVTTAPLPASFTVQEATRQFEMLAKAQQGRNGVIAQRDALRDAVTRERIEVDSLQKKLSVPASPSVEMKLAEYLARVGINTSADPGAVDRRLDAEVKFYRDHQSAQRGEINHLRDVAYQIELRAYEGAKATYDDAVKANAKVAEIMARTHAINGVGINGSHKTQTSGKWIELAANDPTRRFDREEHFAGIVTYYGKRPDNAAMLKRAPGRDVAETGKMMANNGLPNRNPREIKDPQAVINGVHRIYSGDDFDGWVFTTSAGMLDARLGGGERSERYEMPSLPPEYEWELCGIQLEGGWIDHANLKFRVIFRDRKREMPVAPVEPTKPVKPEMFEQ